MRYLRLIVAVVALLGYVHSEACTSAIVSGKRSANGRALLWKHRDTDHENNFMASVKSTVPGQYDYVALFNAGDSLLAEAWTGYNRAGFAIMNTASYNLRPDTASYKDKEGVVMTEALKMCASLADFENLLDRMPKPLGVQANFGVIDSAGDAAYYEVTDDTWRKYPMSDSEDGVLVRTNYSYSGNSEDGYGYIRERNECYLLEPYKGKLFTPADFTEGFSRSFYHSMMGKDMLAEGGTSWLVDQDFIPRSSSSASIVIEGGKDGGEPRMWIAIGYPPCSVVELVTIDNVPADLQPDPSTGHSPRCDEVLARKSRVFPIKRGSGPRYINVETLRHYNDSCRNESLKVYKAKY